MSETLMEGHLVKIGDDYFRIKSHEAFNYITGDSSTAEFTAVATGSTSGWTNIDVLEPDRLHLYQIWFGVKDGQRYYIKIPTGTNRLGVDEDQDVGYIDSEKSPQFAKNKLYEFWLIKNMYPAINAENDTGKTLTPIVWFEGMKYELEKYTGSQPTIYKIVTIGGLGTKVINQ